MAEGARAAEDQPVALALPGWRSVCAPGSAFSITERLTEDERTCGFCAIDLRNGHVTALLRFETAVQEVFAVTVPPGRRYPDLINDDDTLLENSFVFPHPRLFNTRGATAP